MNKDPSAATTTPKAGREASAPVLLSVRGLRKSYRAPGLFGGGAPSVVVDDVSFDLARGEAVALVGQSGSGKSTLARMLLRLEEADAGEIVLDGLDVRKTEPRRASLAYRRRVQMVFQDPFASLSPLQSVFEHLATPLRCLLDVPSSDLRGRALSLLRDVGLEPAEELADRFPHTLSGGQRQRVAIARALASEPSVLVADEPTSMLDVSIRTGVLALLTRLRREHGLSVLLITHDLAAARIFADRILVLFHGRVVESGPSREVVTNPAHAYTRSLIDALGSVRGVRAYDNPALAASRTNAAGSAVALPRADAPMSEATLTPNER